MIIFIRCFEGAKGIPDDTVPHSRGVVVADQVKVGYRSSKSALMVKT